MDQSIFKAEGNSAVRFYHEAVRNNFLSERHGRPIFDNVLFAEIITPGSASSTPIIEIERTLSAEASPEGAERQVIVNTEAYSRFREQVEAFKAQNGEGTLDGTPLHHWPQIDVGTAATFRALGIITVEQLAEVSDGNLSNLGTGARMLREQARSFIASRQFGVPTAQMTAENVNLRTENERLIRELAEANETIARLSLAANAAETVLEAVNGSETVLVSEPNFDPPPQPSLDPLAGVPAAPQTI